jgi:hypothetical protein
MGKASRRYRVASFDVHGKALKSIFEEVFPNRPQFHVLNFDNLLELIADSYDLIWSKIK